MSELLLLFLTFLKIGAVSFGGGYGMIPLIKEAVIANNWLTEDEFINFIAVSESTPGPIAINMATFIGSTQGGFLGAVLATLGVVLPAFVIILIVASVIKGLLQFAGVKAFLGGVRPIVNGLIIATALSMVLSIILSLKTVESDISYDWRALVILAVLTVSWFIMKKFFKKDLSPFIMIIASAALGIVFYGFLGFL